VRAAAKGGEGSIANRLAPFIVRIASARGCSGQGADAGVGHCRVLAVPGSHAAIGKHRMPHSPEPQRPPGRRTAPG
jgi:hypothetical protein